MKIDNGPQLEISEATMGIVVLEGEEEVEQSASKKMRPLPKTNSKSPNPMSKKAQLLNLHSRQVQYEESLNKTRSDVYEKLKGNFAMNIVTKKGPE